MQKISDTIAESTITITIAKWIGTAAAAIWLSVPLAIKILMCMQVLDVITGFMNKERRLLDSLWRTGTILIICLSVHFMYSAVKAQGTLNLGFELGAGFAIFYCYETGISIIKNCSAGNIPMPPFVFSALLKVNALTPQEKQEITALKLKQDQATAALTLPEDLDPKGH